MNALQELLSGYPESRRPQDSAFLRRLQYAIDKHGLTPEQWSRVVQSILDSEITFPSIAQVRAHVDAIMGKHRGRTAGQVSSQDFEKWKREACSLEDAWPYMLETLVDTGIMSEELLRKVTGRIKHLGGISGDARKRPRVDTGWATPGQVIAWPGSGPGSQRGARPGAGGTDAGVIVARPGDGSISALTSTGPSPPTDLGLRSDLATGPEIADYDDSTLEDL